MNTTMSMDKQDIKKLNKKLESMTKPVKPVSPKWENYKHFDRHMGEVNADNVPITSNPEFIAALKKFHVKEDQYKKDIVLWNQLKLIKKIKYASLAKCITEYEINKK